LINETNLGLRGKLVASNQDKQLKIMITRDLAIG